MAEAEVIVILVSCAAFWAWLAAVDAERLDLDSRSTAFDPCFVVDEQDAADDESYPEPYVNRDGVDLTQIQEMKAMTPTERIRTLVADANNLIRVLQDARRI